MRRSFVVSVLVAAALVVPWIAAADPPSHAPAHGYRAKQKQKTHAPAPRKSGIEVVFDSERGIQIAVGVPDVFFHEGHYYRERDGRWEVSLSGDGGWRFSVASKIPGVVIEADRKTHPGPAKRSGGKRKNKKKKK